MVLRQCNVCGRHFNKTEHFKRHERSHTQERPYRCSVCDKAFARSDVLSRHMKGHGRRLSTAGSINSVDRGDASTVTATSGGIANTHNNQHHREPVPGITPSENLGWRNPIQGVPGIHSLTSEYPHVPASSHRLSIVPSGETPSLAISNSWNPTPIEQNLGPSPQTVSQPSPNNHKIANETAAFAASPSNTAHTAGNHFTASEITPPNQPHSHIGFGTDNDTDFVLGDADDPLHLWLCSPTTNAERHHTPLYIYGGSSSNTLTPRDSGSQTQLANPPDALTRRLTIGKVPRERFSRVARCWRSMSDRLLDPVSTFWLSSIHASTEETLSQVPPSNRPYEGLNWTLDDESRLRLERAFRKHNAPEHMPIPPTPSSEQTSGQTSGAFPPPEILDIALSLYFRRFHPTLPLIHVPTFCIGEASSTLLLAVCLIGLSVLGTTGAIDFVKRAFRGLLQDVCAEVSSSMTHETVSKQTLATFTSAVLTLNLAALIDDPEYLSLSRSLYASVGAIAQQRGLFAVRIDGDIDKALSVIRDDHRQWKAWCRVQSLHRLAASLLLIDAWFTDHFGSLPVLRSESVWMTVPGDEPHFKANSPMEWQSLPKRSYHLHGTSLTLDHLADPRAWSNASELSGSFAISALLALVQLHALESSQRLMMPARPVGSRVPWQYYVEDPLAKTLSKMLTSASIIVSPQVTTSDINTKVLWHGLCISLLADFRLFELAAGRHGPDPGIGALDEIAVWTRSPSARRACIHAAQNFRLMSNRRVSDVVTIHSVTALFHSALVLGLYLFMVPPTLRDGIGDYTIVELVDTEDIDWVAVSDVGMSGSSGLAQTSTGGVPSSPVERFIWFGGTVSLSGVPQHGGYDSARRVLLDFANLMDGISGRKSHTFTRVLHIMGDDLSNVDLN